MESPFTSKPEPGLALLYHLYASFKKYETFGLESNDKSVNAHNCRKSAILSQMFILHKLISVAGADKGLSVAIKDHFVKYASAYLELISVSTDL
jgi:hypothetical protein